MLLLFLLTTALLLGLFFLFGVVMLKILYFCCIGLPVGLCLGVIGVLCCITIIGIPLGVLCFRMAGFVIAPLH